MVPSPGIESKSADVAQLVEQLIRNCHSCFTFNNLASSMHPLNPSKSR